MTDRTHGRSAGDDSRPRSGTDGGAGEGADLVDRAIGDLGDALGNARPQLSEDAAVRLAVEGRRPPKLWWTPSPAWRWAVPAFAAVALAWWIGVRPDAAVMPAETFRADLVVDDQEPESFSVRAPSEGQVAVFQTKNDRIRVVWYY